MSKAPSDAPDFFFFQSYKRNKISLEAFGHLKIDFAVHSNRANLKKSFKMYVTSSDIQLSFQSIQILAFKLDVTDLLSKFQGDRKLSKGLFGFPNV